MYKRQVCNGDETYETCPQDCLAPGTCPDGQVVDCDGTGECWPLSWIGDGFPDCEDQQYGADLTCYDNDGGDCGGFFSSNDRIRPISNDSQITKVFNPIENNRERDTLTGYRLYRSTTSGSGFSLVVETDANTTTHTDTGLTNGQTYYYVVTSVYDNDNESNYSNQVDLTPMSTVVFSMTDATTMGGDEVMLTVSMNNLEPVAGVQFNLDDTPDYLTLLSAVGTDRIPTDWSISTSDTDGSGLVLGFSFQGTTIGPGNGPVLELTFSTAATEPSNVSVCIENETVSDVMGGAFLTDAGCGTVTLDVEGIDITFDVPTLPIDQGQTGNIGVNMSTPSDVYGVELHITDTPESITALDVVPGDLVAGLNGTVSFSEVNGEIIALWFSLTGEFIPAGSSGTLFDVSFAVDDDAPNGSVTCDLTTQTTFSDSQGQSMFWGYEPASMEVGLPEITLSMVQVANDAFDIIMTNSGVVSGFQFGIDDNPDYYTFNNIVPTDRVPADWSLSGNENAGDAVLLGFSFQGTTIQPGDGAIARVYVEPTSELNEFSSELCFADYVLSNPQAEEYYSFAACETMYMPFEEPTPPLVLNTTPSDDDDSITLDWSCLLYTSPSPRD